MALKYTFKYLKYFNNPLCFPIWLIFKMYFTLNQFYLKISREWLITREHPCMLLVLILCTNLLIVRPVVLSKHLFNFFYSNYNYLRWTKKSNKNKLLGDYSVLICILMGIGDSAGSLRECAAAGRAWEMREIFANWGIP